MRATVPSWGLFIGIHTHVLPNGNVLSWQGHNDDPMTPGMVMGTGAYLWNSTRPMPTTHDFFIDWTNAFCTGHSFLADGKLLVTGGHYGNMVSPAPKNNPYIQGLRDASTYNYTVTAPATTAAPAPGWQPEQRMARNRWYPTNTTLSNVDVLTTAGETEPNDVLPDTARYPELWQNGIWKRLTGAPKILPTYPWMFQAPNGKVFYAGPGNEMSYVNPYYVNPATGKRGTWTPVDVPNRAYPFRGQGTAAMFWPGRILVVGGSDGTTVTNTAEVIDLTAGTNGSVTGADGFAYARPTVTLAGTLRHARHHINATLLPNGTPGAVFTPLLVALQAAIDGFDENLTDRNQSTAGGTDAYHLARTAWLAFVDDTMKDHITPKLRKLPGYADFKKFGKSKLSALKQPKLLTESRALVALYRAQQAALYPTLEAEAQQKYEALAAADETRDTQDATITEAILDLADDRAAIAHAQRRLKAQLELTFDKAEKVYSFFDFSAAKVNKSGKVKVVVVPRPA